MRCSHHVTAAHLHTLLESPDCKHSATHDALLHTQPSAVLQEVTMAAAQYAESSSGVAPGRYVDGLVSVPLPADGQ